MQIKFTKFLIIFYYFLLFYVLIDSNNKYNSQFKLILFLSLTIFIINEVTRLFSFLFDNGKELGSVFVLCIYRIIPVISVVLANYLIYKNVLLEDIKYYVYFSFLFSYLKQVQLSIILGERKLIYENKLIDLKKLSNKISVEDKEIIFNLKNSNKKIVFYKKKIKKFDDLKKMEFDKD